MAALVVDQECRQLQTWPLRTVAEAHRTATSQHLLRLPFGPDLLPQRGIALPPSRTREGGMDLMRFSLHSYFITSVFRCYFDEERTFCELVIYLSSHGTQIIHDLVTTVIIQPP